MNLSRYRKLLSDKHVLRCNGDCELYVMSPNKKLVIGFYYVPISEYVKLYGEINSRSLLFVYPADNWPNFKPLSICNSEHPLILVNPDHQDHAYTYRLSIDEAQGEASIQLQDSPEHGQMFITNRELIGITKSVWREGSRMNAMR